MDWEAVCKGEELAIVPDLNLACKDCVFIPKNRQNQVRDNDFDELHYQCASHPAPAVVSAMCPCRAPLRLADC